MKEEYLGDPDSNGLTLYSHIHICKFGFLGVNNLQIDHNLHVRSYNFIELPEYKKPSVAVVPGAPKVISDKRQVRVTHLLEKNALNIIIRNEISDYQINVGTIDFSKMAARKTIRSMNGKVIGKFYYSNSVYTSQMEKWGELFLNLIEYLLPSKLGVILEVLQFIMEEKNEFPSQLDKNIIQTILSSHDIFFEIIAEEDKDQLMESYGESEGSTMIKILEAIKQDMMIQLHQLVLDLKEDIIFIIYCALILERHGYIIIHRPGIIENNI